MAPVSSDVVAFCFANPTIRIMAWNTRNQRFEESPFRQFFPVNIDRGQRLEAMIGAGHYGFVEEDIEDYFEIKGEEKGRRILRLVGCNRRIDTKTILDNLSSNGFRPAVIEEFLAFNANYRPDQTEDFTLVCLGSVASVQGIDQVLYSQLTSGKYDLLMARFPREWDAAWHFLAVRNEAA